MIYKNNNMVVIIDEEAFLQKLAAMLRPSAEPKVLAKDKEAMPEWLLLKEAKKILPYQSKKKWRQLRDNHEIEFSTHGRQFLYNKESLLVYILKKSTLRATLNKKTTSSKYF